MKTIGVENKHGIPGRAESYWLASSEVTDYPDLSPANAGITVDVAVIGGGIAGISSAVLMKEAGLKVAVIEARRIAQGVTGNTTAKVSSLHRLIFKHLISDFGSERARQYAEANQAAIDKIEAGIRQMNIACDFKRLPFYTFAETGKYLKEIEGEIKAAQSLGLPVSFSSTIPLPLTVQGAIRLENQAQFHPRKYLLSLASSIPGSGSFIFEKSRVIDIRDEEPCTILTDKGEIKARQVVITTNFPIHDKDGVYFARMQPMRSYALGIKLRETFPEAMFINAEHEGHSFRAQPADEGEIVIIGGNDHVTGHEPDTVSRYRGMAEFVNRIYDNPRIEYSWSTQDPITLDKVPYIGKMTPWSKHLFVATGFGQWGMSTSMAAAMILTDLVQERENPWADVFSPSRLRPDASAAKKLVSQNLKVVEKLIEGHISGKSELSQVAPGKGKIVEVDNQRAAAYRSAQGQVFVLSPNCTHMGCVVTWNDAEKTWDCPCHGSRYDANGEVIQSPAIKGLIPLKSTISETAPTAVEIARTADLAPGQKMGIESQGLQIFLANIDGHYYAMGNICTHRGCRLSEGTLRGDQLQCRCHGSIFNVRTGEVVHGPAEKPEPSYQVRVEGDRILLEV